MKAGCYARLRPGKKYDLLTTLAASGIFDLFRKVVDADTKSAISGAARLNRQRISALPCEGMACGKARQLGFHCLAASSPICVTECNKTPG
jgi:hypothetical protein